MNKTELFQGYLDNEISSARKDEVEKLIQTDPESRDLYEKMRNQKLELLAVLDEMNPKEKVTIPHLPDRELKVSSMRNWRIAAGIAILLGLTISLWLLKQETGEEKDISQYVEIQELETLDDDLDFYISPNRCWNERKLKWTIIEIK